MNEENNVIKEKGECYPFICPKCRGFNDCEYTINGMCLCPWCDEEKINEYKKGIENGMG